MVGQVREHGLAVVGVQTPEFEFEGDLDDVAAIEELDVRHPVVVDNDYAVWRAFDNDYWPALYFGDAEGRIRHHHFGEGNYEESEMVLQMLFREAGAEVGDGLVRIEPDGVEAAADWASLGSPETYVGYGRAVGFASPAASCPTRATCTRRRPGCVATSGRCPASGRSGWCPRCSTSLAAPISYQFRARDVHLVMGPPAGQPPVRFRVRLDGEPPGPAHGVDVDERGDGSADYQRMYQLDPSDAPDRRPALRDRVPRRGRRGIRVHLRVTQQETLALVTGLVGRPTNSVTKALEPFISPTRDAQLMVAFWIDIRRCHATEGCV